MIVVVGIGADGWDGLDRRRRDAVKGADVVLGGERHLQLLPELVKGQRIAWPSPLPHDWGRGGPARIGFLAVCWAGWCGDRVYIFQPW